MIVDSMTKTEVMKSLRKEFDTEVLDLFDSKLLKYKAVADKQMGTSNKPIRIPRQRYVSKSGVNFAFDLTITRKGYSSLFYAFFRWHNRSCYATFTMKGAVDVFQHHALARYAERQLEENPMELRKDMEIFELIAPKMNNCFSIVLPSPTHRYCHYLPLAQALFLGDYDPSTTELFSWHNTCISPRQMGRSQDMIVHLLNNLGTFINKTGIDPFLTTSDEDDEEKKMQIYLKKNPDSTPDYIDSLKDELLLVSLIDRFDYPEIQLREFKPIEENLIRKMEGFNLSPRRILESEKAKIDRMMTEIQFRQ